MDTRFRVEWKAMRKAALALMITLLLAGCGGSGGGGSDTSSLKGAGSSLVDPLVQAWIPEVKDQASLDVTYNPNGTGGGVPASTDRTGDFGASQAPTPPSQADAG